MTAGHHFHPYADNSQSRTMTSFFQPGPAPDPAYVNTRDLQRGQTHREYVERLWAWFEPLSDRHFLSDAKAHFLERFWEMYLAKALDSAGLSPKKSGNSGPDFYIHTPERRIFFEATAPGPGEGLDTVPELIPLNLQSVPEIDPVPEEKILLRLRSAIRDKLKKWGEWRARGRIGDQDGFVIAINGRQTRPAPYDSEPPFILRAVLPIGPLMVGWDTSSHEVVDTHYKYRDMVTKMSGEEIRTDIFLSPDFADVSAVISSFLDTANYPKIEGEDFRLVHNPKAKCPFPRHLFARGREYWVEGDQLVLK